MECVHHPGPNPNLSPNPNPNPNQVAYLAIDTLERRKAEDAATIAELRRRLREQVLRNRIRVRVRVRAERAGK